MKNKLIILISLIVLGSGGLLFCRHGHHHHHHGSGTGVGVAAGLIGASVIAGAAANSDSGDNGAARSAEFEAKRAQAKAEELRSEGMNTQVYDLQHKIALQKEAASSNQTINILIFAIAFLFIGIAALGIIAFKKG
jgi:hypothetical protein